MLIDIKSHTNITSYIPMHTRVRETSKFHLSTYVTTSLITSLSDIQGGRNWGYRGYLGIPIFWGFYRVKNGK